MSITFELKNAKFKGLWAYSVAHDCRIVFAFREKDKATV